ncbi:VapE domain-containing protein [Bradyrhizobium sp. Bra78]|uniref:VapE domain-containing protein n=1 Tax=Bradyrhizobium sp. Bra78 TaxID=2926010 RepID=UPI0021C71C03|nr:VapE domain-containing protein [Bradyrhizobium sp. Bra78]
MSAGTSSALSVALDYIKREWAVVPIDHKQKAPKIKAWEKLFITAENAAEFFNGAKQNIGVQLGAKSKGLADVDLDCAEAVKLAPYFLPPTDAVFGRASKPSSHYLYIIDDAPGKGTEQLKDENKKTIIELRMGGGGAAAQTVFPGSTHPSGETIQWDKNGAQAKSNYQMLKQAMTKIAIGAILMRQWPKGSGHEAAQTVGGVLARCGWDAEDIGDFVGILTRVAGELPTEDDNKRTAKNAAEAHSNGQHSFGFPKLAEDWGEKSAKAIAKILGYKRENSAHVRASIGSIAWRERRVDGLPRPSMHSARLAITALGIECRHDIFHHKILFGFRGDNMQHEMQSLVGEVTDDSIIMLRQLLSDHFGVDFLKNPTIDAVISLANQHRFDPVLDMLAKAEAEWDGKPRLDRMAVDYFNTDDTLFNTTALRITMIAAARRARHPGCKFDEITVTESPEGYGKSGAWRVLAGEDNFSDQSILGKNGREVQEQLSSIWIHENAELAGLGKTEIESVKAFASRQEDIARPAYGRFIYKQPRHSIEVGTTNDDEYLQSQTGNRRFWTLRIRRAIDLDKLRQDRLLLWGEAARREALGESIRLDQKLWAVASMEQENRRIKDGWEDILANIPEEVPLPFARDSEPNTCQIIHFSTNQEKVRSADILTHVLKIPAERHSSAYAMRVARIMKRHGWQRTSNGKVSINSEQVRGCFRQRDGVLPLPETQ